MNRRDFLKLAAAAPIVGAGIVATKAEPKMSPLQPLLDDANANALMTDREQIIQKNAEWYSQHHTCIGEGSGEWSHEEAMRNVYLPLARWDMEFNEKMEEDLVESIRAWIEAVG